MSDGSDSLPKEGLNRREFLSASAVPIAAAALSGSKLAAEGSRATIPSQDVIRLGFIGAGANVRNVMIPRLLESPGVELLAVANRSLESSQRAADEVGISRAYSHWEELLRDDDVDAVVIGTWPYMHRTLTLASLEAGKHTLCQARMANTAQEARDMLEASLRYPHLVSQLVPTSTSYAIDNVIMEHVDGGFFGEVLSVEIQRLLRDTRATLARTGPNGFAHVGGDLLWRHNRQYSGYNILNIGSTMESMIRWFGRGTRVMAMTKVHVPYRYLDGKRTSVTIPDHVDVMYELMNGAQAHMRFSASTGHSNGNQTWIYGTEGTLHVDEESRIFAGRKSDSGLSEVPNGPERRVPRIVERQFINAIRGTEEVTMVPFETGVHYMEFTEAVTLSARSGQAVYLPL